MPPQNNGGVRTLMNHFYEKDGREDTDKEQIYFCNKLDSKPKMLNHVSNKRTNQS